MQRSGEERFQAALAAGNLGEDLVVRWLTSRRAGVVPAFDFKSSHGGAPKLLVERGGHVLPDLDVCGPEGRFWLEVKTYHGPAWNERRSTPVHGFARRLVLDYQAVQERSGSPVYVAVLEYSTGNDPKAPGVPGALRVVSLSRIISDGFDCQCGPCEGRAPGTCRARSSGAGKEARYWSTSIMARWRLFPAEEIAPIAAAMSALRGTP